MNIFTNQSLFTYLFSHCSLVEKIWLTLVRSMLVVCIKLLYFQSSSNQIPSSFPDGSFMPTSSATSAPQLDIARHSLFLWALPVGILVCMFQDLQPWYSTQAEVRQWNTTDVASVLWIFQVTLLWIERKYSFLPFSLRYLTESLSMTITSGRTAATSCVWSMTEELVMSRAVPSTACCQSSVRGPSAHPVPRNRQETSTPQWTLISHVLIPSYKNVNYKH